MKKLQTGILIKYNGLIRILLALMGFSTACFPGPMEYGTPSATYIVKGNVKSEKTAGNIPGIRVILKRDTAYTDAAGNYRVSTMAFPDPDTIMLKFRDADSIINREYQGQDTLVDFKDAGFTGGDGNWYKGKAVKEINIRLKDNE